MATQTLIKPQTAAGTALLITDVFDSVVVHADGLAGAEEVDILIVGGSGAVPYYEDGVAVKLTAAQPNRELPTGPTYQTNKDATAGACGVYASVRGVD